jgi:CheY-like chemotaxis protein
VTEQRTILIVDDDAGNRALLRIYLSKKGYALREAEDGEQGLQMAQAVDVDLVLLDQMMPRMDGVEVLEALRALGNHVPVILLTAVTDADAVVKAMDAGADDYVTKPFSLPVLAARMERRLRPAAPFAAEVVEVGEEQVILEVESAPAPASPLEASGFDAVVLAPISPAGPPPVPAASTSLPPSVSSGGLFARLKVFSKKLLGDDAGVAAGFLLDGRYRLDAQVGSGKMGAVWRARHLGLDVDVAIKILHSGAPALRKGETARESLSREAVMLARAHHRNSVRALDCGVSPGGHAFLVMELLSGEPLRVRLARERHLPVVVAFGIVADVCAALGAAHRFGVVHRDVKALNVLLAVEDPEDAPVTKLCDFGAACSVDDPGAGALLVGTPSHMAPERFDDPRATPASDVYAAGVMLHHLVTGVLPFVGSDVQALARLHQHNAPRSPSSLVDDLPAGVDDAVARLLRKAPADRPSAREAARLLRSIARSQQQKDRKKKR